ncbi:MAG: hypothetical protein ACI9YO_002983 [Gammaproteobacteria bacterium]|jgi:hypothetical protein
MSTQINLVVPGLFNLPLEEFAPDFLASNLPALNQILSYSNPIPNDQIDFESIIASSLGLTGRQTLPFAQAYVEEAVDEPHRYLLCRTIHLKADMHNALVVPLESNSVNEVDSTLILEDLQAFFSEDCDLKPLDNGLWLMRLKHCEASDCYPHYLSMIGRKANQFIEQSKHALPWYKLMNEMQMFMHQHPINQNRLTTGLLPINSLWFWGAGEKLRGEKPKFDDHTAQWFCDDEQLIRFADSSNIQHWPLDQLTQMKSSKNAVVIDLSLLEALKSSSGDDLQAKLEILEKMVFKPALILFRSSRVSLQLRAGHRFDLTMTPFSKYKIWRSSKNLVSFGQPEME